MKPFIDIRSLLIWKIAQLFYERWINEHNCKRICVFWTERVLIRICNANTLAVLHNEDYRAISRHRRRHIQFKYFSRVYTTTQTIELFQETHAFIYNANTQSVPQRQLHSHKVFFFIWCVNVKYRRSHSVFARWTIDNSRALVFTKPHFCRKIWTQKIRITVKWIPPSQRWIRRPTKQVSKKNLFANEI